MIRKLQRKFIGIVMLSLGIVIVILLGSINLFKYYNTANHADDMLRYLSENNGRFPDEKKLPSEKWDKPKPDGINEETGFKTRYFVIWLDIKGNVLRINTGHIASVSSEEAIAYGQRAVAEGKSNGYDGHYRYGVMSTADGSMVIFLDCSTELNSDRIFLLLSFAIGTVAFALVSFIAALFSRRAIRPFQEAMQKQQQFLEDAGHELKTPLAIISANNDVLELTDGKSQWTDSIRNQVSRMDSLLQSMLALTKLDMERPVLQMQSVHLSRLVSETIESFRILAQANQVVLTDSVQPGVDVTGDPASLQQLISILLENAVKYGINREGKRIVNISVKEMEEEFIVRISDKGKGFPAEVADMLEKGDTVGRSIGLSNVYKRMKSTYGEDGRIKISSSGDGSCVELCFKKGR